MCGIVFFIVQIAACYTVGILPLPVLSGSIVFYRGSQTKDKETASYLNHDKTEFDSILYVLHRRVNIYTSVAPRQTVPASVFCNWGSYDPY